VGDEHAGRRVKCPACGAVVAAPKPQPQFEVVDEEEEPQFEIVEDEPPEVPRARPAKKATSPDDDDDDEPRPKKAKRNRDDDDDERPRRKKKKRRRRGPPPRMPAGYEDDYGGGGRGGGGDGLSGLDLMLCLCPGIGCTVGLVKLITGSGDGAKMMGLSIVVAVIYNIIGFAIRGAGK
jgi:hypothetical protein